MRTLITALVFLTLTACSETHDTASEEVEADITPQKQLEADAKTIEQAADEAVKLIEADAKAEIDQDVAEAK
ncbi:MAG: hypothetical protein ABI668_10690 [Sphingorhabdus sp.]